MGVGQRFGLERRHFGLFARVGHFFVGPVHYLLVFNLLLTATKIGEQFDCVRTHELPHDGEDQFAVAVANIAASNSDKLATQVFRNFHSVVAVFDSLEFQLRVLVDFFPVDATGFDLFAHAQNVFRRSQISVQVVDVVAIRAEHRVHPHAKDALFTSAFTIFEQISRIKVLRRRKSRVVVKNLCEERIIQTLVSRSNHIGVDDGNELLTTMRWWQLPGVADDVRCALLVFLDLEGLQVARPTIDLVEKYGVQLTVLHIFAKVRLC
mmetsp:Transcript_48768/g.72440  ORF Transcript_48768/g.72440 Transcript_48768/m.72440 type:complete len:265 (+) Transcript_48768:469-1263(+)